MDADARFVMWYQSEHPRVVRTLALAIGDMEAARDAADEAFARALQRWRRVEQMRAPSGWTYRVALNVARRRFRRRALELAFHWAQQQPGLVELQPVDHELWAAVGQLPARQRTAVALRYVADLSERQIAEAMRISPGTVAATLNAARKRLAAQLTADDEHQGAHHD